MITSGSLDSLTLEQGRVPGVAHLSRTNTDRDRQTGLAPPGDRSCFDAHVFVFFRCYYIVVVPVSQSTRRWKNPDEMELDEVTSQTALD